MSTGWQPTKRPKTLNTNILSAGHRPLSSVTCHLFQPWAATARSFSWRWAQRKNTIGANSPVIASKITSTGPFQWFICVQTSYHCHNFPFDEFQKNPSTNKNIKGNLGERKPLNIVHCIIVRSFLPSSFFCTLGRGAFFLHSFRNSAFPLIGCWGQGRDIMGDVLNNKFRGYMHQSLDVTCHHHYCILGHRLFTTAAAYHPWLHKVRGWAPRDPQKRVKRDGTILDYEAQKLLCQFLHAFSFSNDLPTWAWLP